MIKVIVFDFSEVIAEGPMSRWVKDNYIIKSDKFDEYKKGAHLWDSGKVGLYEIYQRLGAITEIAPNLIWDKFYKKAKLNKEVVEVIKKLKVKYKIVLFSNFYGEILRRLLDHYGITALFDEIIISSEHKMRKPDPKFFEILVQAAKVKENEIFFTDDKQKHVDAANGLGIKAYQFTNAQKLIKDLQKEGINT